MFSCSFFGNWLRLCHSRTVADGAVWNSPMTFLGQYCWVYSGESCCTSPCIVIHPHFVSQLCISFLFSCPCDRCACHQSHTPLFPSFLWDLLLCKEERVSWGPVKLPPAITGHWEACQGERCFLFMSGPAQPWCRLMQLMSVYTTIVRGWKGSRCRVPSPGLPDTNGERVPVHLTIV